jgi:hypothetical protein
MDPSHGQVNRNLFSLPKDHRLQFPQIHLVCFFCYSVVEPFSAPTAMTPVNFSFLPSFVSFLHSLCPFPLISPYSSNPSEAASDAQPTIYPQISRRSAVSIVCRLGAGRPENRVRFLADVGIFIFDSASTLAPGFT